MRVGHGWSHWCTCFFAIWLLLVVIWDLKFRSQKLLLITFWGILYWRWINHLLFFFNYSLWSNRPLLYDLFVLFNQLLWPVRWSVFIAYLHCIAKLVDKLTILSRSIFVSNVWCDILDILGNYSSRRIFDQASIFILDWFYRFSRRWRNLILQGTLPSQAHSLIIHIDVCWECLLHEISAFAALIIAGRSIVDHLF